ncbi:hypothetical protein [Bacillus sp. Marseille-P3661]|uniref:hypothetical protein n=1 Tax=Bacillus sp. Marseille-P3661 TaxID=1936234 RepID=UPI000C8540FF|nr:hypothetical protein [Bacillus sp. Marseille-P3661]
MRYIIEHANVVLDKGIIVRSFLVEDKKIGYYSTSLKQYKGMRMDASSYFMTSGQIINDLDLLTIANSFEYRNRIKKLIQKGCTTILTSFYMAYEEGFKQKLDYANHCMINSTLDYEIGLQLPVEKLTPTMIRLCKKHKIPFILVDISDHTNLYYVPWGWIREAMYLYNVPIYPLWKTENKKIYKEQKQLWEEICTINKIPTHLNFPTDLSPIPKTILKQIGLYPKKGELLIGNDLDYNLYSFPSIDSKVEEKDKLDYDKQEPIITVHKGRIMKVMDTVNYFPGYGEKLKVNIPGLFATIQ